MSLSRIKIVFVFFSASIWAGCVLGPQPEPPDSRDEVSGNREDPSDGEYDECGCDPSAFDDDGDGIADCFPGSWACDDRDCAAGGDGDTDTDVDDEEPPPAHDGGEEQVMPTHEQVQWPVDPSDVLGGDDTDADTIVVGDY